MPLGLPYQNTHTFECYTREYFTLGNSITLSHTTLALEMTIKSNHKLHLQELEVLDKKRFQAQQHIELYKAKITRAFNKILTQRVFKLGDLILTVRLPMIINHKSRGKFSTEAGGNISDRICLLP